ncbi:ATPase AAA [Clostridia bacterium]|nr:ATPase AAA [Clostridia bacterium]
MNSTDTPQILVFAGPNGSGKSSVTSAWQIVGLYINADDIKVRRGSKDIEAAVEAERLRELCLSERRSFTFETVLSTNRNLDLLARAKAAGFHIEGVFVLTVSAELNVFRVRSRELSGGHSVPPYKIRSRYGKSFANIPRLLSLCDVLRIVDNTSEPETIYIKDAHGTQIMPNRYWTAEAIEKLT